MDSKPGQACVVVISELLVLLMTSQRAAELNLGMQRIEQNNCLTFGWKFLSFFF